jgi:diguanylate cyclase (GGDEF)-like protein
VDVNNFKEINDKDGHDFGDYALKKVAAVIRKSFNSHYTCFRVGGDEFSRDTDRVKLERQLKKMIVNIEKERQKESRLPTVSYGYSIFIGGKALDLREVIKEADDQMYYYKNIQKERQRTERADFKEVDN